MAKRLAENPGYWAQDVRMSRSKTDVGVDQIACRGLLAVVTIKMSLAETMTF